VDRFVRASEDFARIVADEATDAPRAKESYQKLQKTCTSCHSAFRAETD
jgi:cytochrome c556